MSDSARRAADNDVRWGNAHRHFLRHLAVMPSWHKAVIVIAGLVALLGTIGQILSPRVAAASAPPAAQSSPATASPNHQRSFVSGNPQGPSSSAAQPAAPAADDSHDLIIRLSPHATRVGLSVVLGFVIGWLFRAFLKTMVFLGLVVCGALWLLSHFGILNITPAQVDAIREKSAEAASWLQRHAEQIKTVAMSHLPSAGGGAFGTFLGFHRR